MAFLTPEYRALIEASPFCILATAGEGGLDATPRGDPAGFVDVIDEKTLLLPDRRGNNRIDSLLNVIGDPRVGLSRALHRSKLWDASLHRPRTAFPSAGQMLKAAQASFAAEDYDKSLDERVRSTLY